MPKSSPYLPCVGFRHVSADALKRLKTAQSAHVEIVALKSIWYSELKLVEVGGQLFEKEILEVQSFMLQ